MIHLTQRYLIWLLACLLALWVTVGPRFLPQAVANDPSVLNPELSLVTYNPPNRGAPGRTGDAATRRCPGLIALQPSETNWGETIDTHPTFWVYLSDAAESVTLTLSDEYSEQVIYETTFVPAAGEGIGRYTLPYNAPSLALDTLYRWQMTINCPTADRSPRVDGVIMRRAISEALQAELNEAAPRDRIVLLSADGLWYNALDELAELRLADSFDEALAADWANLLEYVQPLVNTEGGLAQPIIGLYPQGVQE